MGGFRVGEGGLTYASYMSALTCEAIWAAVRHVAEIGDLGNGTEIEVSRPGGSLYGRLSIEAVDKFVKISPKRAEEYLKRNLS